MDTPLSYPFIHCWSVSLLPLLAITDNASLNICNTSLCVGIFFFISLGYIPRKAIAGSYSSSIVNHLRNCQAICPSTAPYHIPTSSLSDSNFSTSSLTLAIICFFIFLIRGDGKRYFTRALTCTPLMTNDVQHLFTG